MVDIGFVDFGVEFGILENDLEVIVKKMVEVKEWLEGVRKEFMLMS